MQEVVEQLIDMALREDIRDGDVTSEYFVPEDRQAKALMLVKATGVLSGVEIGKRVFEKVDPALSVDIMLEDGNQISTGAYVMEITGSARSILTAERTALNFMQRLSGVATKTASFVEQTKGTNAQILDTRKTTPGWRFLEKAAVAHGGGTNHRMGLYDRAMVKDNHLVAEGGIEMIKEAIARLKLEKPNVEIELEADRLDQVEQFLDLKDVNYILLDNMRNEDLREAVKMRGHRSVALEASGGVNLRTVRGIAETGVDFISVGAITHSAVALDISLEFLPMDG